jgi:hypothetical protein
MSEGSAITGAVSAPPRGRVAVPPFQAPVVPPPVAGPVLPAPLVPISYLEDPDQVAIYRWRAMATTAILLALLFVLSWAAGELWRSAVDLLRPVGEAVRLTG